MNVGATIILTKGVSEGAHMLMINLNITIRSVEHRGHQFYVSRFALMYSLERHFREKWHSCAEIILCFLESCSTLDNIICMVWGRVRGDGSSNHL